MIYRSEFPILEFDDSPRAKLEPSMFVDYPFDTDKLVITFFPEVINKLKEQNAIEQERIIDGENPITIYRFIDEPDVLLVLGQVGSPACSGNLDLFSAMGIRKTMFCGGGGVLDSSIGVGEILVVTGAIRDEGSSYHYLPPSRIVYAEEKTNERIISFLEEKGVPYLQGITWTTDAIFRETPDRIALRKSEGARIVEMEQAACLAVAKVRSIDYGALIYGGDDLAGEEWDKRGWRGREGVRYSLVQLCKQLVKII